VLIYCVRAAYTEHLIQNLTFIVLILKALLFFLIVVLDGDTVMHSSVQINFEKKCIVFSEVVSESKEKNYSFS